MTRDQEARISFRPIEIEHDAELIFRWLSDDDVRHWYDEGEHSIANYRQRFAPEATTRKFVFCIDHAPVGYLQAYRLADEPAYAAQVGLEHDAVSIDLFIGVADYRNQGWGSSVLRVALAQIVFRDMAATWACINPDPANLRAVRSYEKAGFRGDRIVWIQDDEPGNTGYERIMLLSRQAFES